METTLMGGKEVCVQRLWSEEEELVLLEGLGESERKKEDDPLYDMDGFLEFKEELIHIIVGQKHLTVEVGEESQEGKNQKDPSFSRPHERRCL
ncbi:hypothetical protein PVL29_020950 [Vitis rotundifolia]|uniref:Glabrous enhancer-binding protein-like DBD domain-containing protein n=1 Tax=Vitis rotundifolia TaxID=103349 RepID=A0AA38YYI9_VITRO|nr:hypothetical protein PVL29_020950 [Vitis rotundifolia]